MTLAVVWLPEAMTAYRALRAADPGGANRVSCAVALLGENPWPDNSNRLGETDFRRLRLEQYRVLYEVIPGTVRVMHVGRVIGG